MDHSDAPSRPTWFDALLEDVDRAFETTGVDTPGWPDPHPHPESPRDEEYSRVSDAGRYRILDARVEAWVSVLAGTGSAETRQVAMQSWIGSPRPTTELMRVRELRPVVHGGLRLLLATTLVDGAPYGLDVAVAYADHRPVTVDSIPDCGCDACDSGSADLMEGLDGWVLTVMRGGVVHARLGECSATRTINGWETRGGQQAWLDESARAPRGLLRWAGTPWR